MCEILTFVDDIGLVSYSMNPNIGGQRLQRATLNTSVSAGFGYMTKNANS